MKREKEVKKLSQKRKRGDSLPWQSSYGTPVHQQHVIVTGFQECCHHTHTDTHNRSGIRFDFDIEKWKKFLFSQNFG